MSTKMTMDEAVKISQEVKQQGGKSEQWLCDKCNWEHMSRTAVILCWGDPRKICSNQARLHEAFDAMEQEQLEEYKDYLKRCNGTPISKIKP